MIIIGFILAAPIFVFNSTFGKDMMEDIDNPLTIVLSIIYVIGVSMFFIGFVWKCWKYV